MSYFDIQYNSMVFKKNKKKKVSDRAHSQVLKRNCFLSSNKHFFAKNVFWNQLVVSNLKLPLQNFINVFYLEIGKHFFQLIASLHA